TDVAPEFTQASRLTLYGPIDVNELLPHGDHGKPSQDAVKRSDRAHEGRDAANVIMQIHVTTEEGLHGQRRRNADEQAEPKRFTHFRYPSIALPRFVSINALRVIPNSVVGAIHRGLAPA